MESLLCKYTRSENYSSFLCSGNIGTELSSTNLGMFITSDAGNSWRQVRPICVYTMHAFTLNRLCTCALSQVCVFFNADF